MKNENYGVIWTVEIEIEELEMKLAPESAATFIE